jgi:hypothetical protein
MEDVQGQLPVPVETMDAHTPPDPRVQALANAQAHGEDLRQRRQHQPLPALVLLQCHSEPNTCNATGGARARARQVQQAIVVDANGPHSMRGPARTLPSQRCSCATCPSLRTLNSRSSTATSGRWWSVLPYSRWKAPCHAVGTRPPAQSGGGSREGGRTGSQQPNPFVH